VEPVLARLLLVSSVVVGIGAPGAHVHALSSSEFSKVDTKVTMSDGVQIAVTFYEPAGTPPAGGWPAVMMFHGLGQTRNTFEFGAGELSANRVAETYLVPRGYAVLTFDARAHGESGGMFSLDGPRELQDTRELFDWLVSHPEINAKRVGAFGVSYGGGMVLLATVSGVPFAAIAVAATWTDLHQALIPQGLIRAGVVVGFTQDIPQSRYAPELLQVLHSATGEQDTPAIRAFLAQRSTRPRLGSVTKPVFLLQGRRDFAFDADQALAAFRLLKGPKRLYLGDLGHAPAPNPVAEVDHFAPEVRSWYDRFLKGENNGFGLRPAVELAPAPWPGKSTVTYDGLPPTRTLHFSAPGTSTLTAEGKVVRTFARVSHVETFGAPTVRVSISSPGGYRHLVAVLSAMKPGTSELVVTDGGIELPKLGAKPRTVTIRLPDEITSIPAGSRLRVTLAATSLAQSFANPVYLLPVSASSAATIRRVTLKLPVLKKTISP
jgi:pimeloyl-ACP methyl ester carboxylesterase